VSTATNSEQVLPISEPPNANGRTKEKSRTQRIMEATSAKTDPTGQTLGAGGSSTYDAFLKAEDRWKNLKSSKPLKSNNSFSSLKGNGNEHPLQSFVTDDGAKGSAKCWEKLRNTSASNIDFDVVVCGGTLGIFIALALQLKGYNVCVIEAGRLQGREQEWNISRQELDDLIREGLLTEEEVERIITTEFPGCRAGFKNEEVPIFGGYAENNIGYECFVLNVLNLGVSPFMLLDIVAKRFQSSGGVLKEFTSLKGVVVSESVGVALDVENSKKGKGDTVMTTEPITTRLLLDCMGNASPISAQQRFGIKPDGICAVVGTCAAGYDPTDNKVGDIIYTNTMIQDKTNENFGQHQYFWEAFPVSIGRNGVTESNVKTTYMFTYMDAEMERPSLETLMEDYWNLLPIYQPSIVDPETDLDIKRVLFAYFPTYRDSPLKPNWSRILAVGDASGIQSPLSFGGFGALTRHLPRLTTAISEALNKDLLHKDDLSLINDYTPNLSAAWMFQKAMSVPRSKNGVDPTFVNRLLATNFEIMNDMGERTLMPFLQDVVRLDNLLGSLSRSFVKDPLFTPQIIQHVGLPVLTDWIGHVIMIAVYTGLHNFVSPVANFLLTLTDATSKREAILLNEKDRFRWRRMIEAWEYGSGSDYKFVNK